PEIDPPRCARRWKASIMGSGHWRACGGFPGRLCGSAPNGAQNAPNGATPTGRVYARVYVQANRTQPVEFLRFLAERGDSNPLRLPVQRFSSSMILMLACAARWLSVGSGLAFPVR